MTWIVAPVAASLLIAKLKDGCTKEVGKYDPEFVLQRINGLIDQEAKLLLE